jgi:tRNA U55 pseudouridine synthase TruB
MNLIEQQKIKDEIREELAKEYSRKDRLLQVNTKRKLETAKKTMKEGLEKELNEQLEAARQESERERCEIARLKSVENIRLKKLKDLKRETDQQLQKQRLNYEKVIQDLRKQVDEIQMSQEPTTSERGHSNGVSGYTEEDGGDVYGSNIKDQMIKMNKGRIP